MKYVQCYVATLIVMAFVCSSYSHALSGLNRCYIIWSGIKKKRMASKPCSNILKDMRSWTRIRGKATLGLFDMFLFCYDFHIILT